MDKTRECKVCKSINFNNQSLRLQYEIPYDEDNNQIMIESVCSEECLHTRMIEIYNQHQCKVTVTYPFKFIEEKFVNKSSIKINDVDDYDFKRCMR